MKLKIRSVKYRTNVSLPGYRTKHVEAEAEVGVKDNPDAVLFHLAKWVHEQLGLAAKTKRGPMLRDMGDEK